MYASRWRALESAWHSGRTETTHYCTRSLRMLKSLLIVGLGSIGKRHARLVRELVPGVQIVALRHDASADLNQPGIDACVTSIDDALQFRPQAAVIANPASFHLDAALPLA